MNNEKTYITSVRDLVCKRYGDKISSTSIVELPWNSVVPGSSGVTHACEFRTQDGGLLMVSDIASFARSSGAGEIRHEVEAYLSNNLEYDFSKAPDLDSVADRVLKDHLEQKGRPFARFFEERADTIRTYNEKHAPEPDFSFETKIDPVASYVDGALDALENDDADPVIEDGFDFLDDEPEPEPAWWMPRP